MPKTILVFIILMTVASVMAQEGWGSEFWQDGYFIQPSIDASRLDENILKAQVDGQWQEFELTQLPETFVSWDTKSRIESLQGILKGEMPGLAGPHNGIIATYGYQREDSAFKVNNAIKGCGFLPKREKIKEMIQLLKDTHEADHLKKLQILTGFYEKADSLFDMTKQVSLELYAKPERGTQTFLNQMTDPTSVIVFMDIPTFKLKTLAYLLHPENPQLNDYEKDVVDYVNRVHSYFHGDFDQQFIAVIYNIVEVYNSSPGTEQGKGTRMK